MGKPKSGSPPGSNAGEEGKKTGTVADSLVKIGEETLKRNPNLSVVYVTADGTSFADRQNAVNHGKTLKDVQVVEVTNKVTGEEPKKQEINE